RQGRHATHGGVGHGRVAPGGDVKAARLDARAVMRPMEGLATGELRPEEM
ncbi:MAG: hypothetical protein HQL56_03195, partial [Magnetococcales bacterium]|nr:hypothetical protein [Magnetococcales bacterium]